jgi:hypothetical protein
VLNKRWHRVGIATMLQLDGPEVDSQSEIFSSPNTSRSALRTTQPLLQWARQSPLTSIYFTFFKVKTGKVFPVHSTKAYRGSRGIIPLILKLCTAAVPPGKKVGTHLIGAWVGPDPIWTFSEREEPLTPTGIRDNRYSRYFLRLNIQ